METKLLQAAIFIVCFLCLGWRGMAQDCSNKTQEVCLSLLTGGGLDLKHIDDDLPQWNETVDMLNGRCKAFDGFSDCMTSVTVYCSDPLQVKYKGWNDAYDFLCKESNKTAVAAFLQCYALPDVASTAEKNCQNVFTSKVDSLLNGSSTIPNDKKTDYCQIADIFFVCLNKTLTDKCGEEAAAWQWTWDRRLSTPLLGTCPGWSAGQNDTSGKPMTAWTVALIVILVLITVVMVVAIACLLVFLFKKRKERSRTREARRRIQQTAQSPPPYSAVIYTQTEPGSEPQAHLVDSSVTLTPSDLGKQNGSVATPSDVVLPPPYIGKQPPAPSYETIKTESKLNETDGEGEDADDHQHNEIDGEHRQPDLHH